MSDIVECPDCHQSLGANDFCTRCRGHQHELRASQAEIKIRTQAARIVELEAEVARKTHALRIAKDWFIHEKHGPISGTICDACEVLYDINAALNTQDTTPENCRFRLLRERPEGPWPRSCKRCGLGPCSFGLSDPLKPTQDNGGDDE